MINNSATETDVSLHEPRISHMANGCMNKYDCHITQEAKTVNVYKIPEIQKYTNLNLMFLLLN